MVGQRRRLYSYCAVSLMLGAILNAGVFCTACAVTFDRQMTGGTVYVTEPIDYRVSAHADDLSPVAASASNLPTGATFDNATGSFSWRPSADQTGPHTVSFAAGQGADAATMEVVYTVEMAALQPGENLRILRPAGGEVYTYGDILTIAFVMVECGGNGDIHIPERGSHSIGCEYTGSQLDWPWFGSDSVDARGVECRYFRSLPGSGARIGFYKLALVDTLAGWGICPAEFGGGSQRLDSIRIGVRDPYATNTCLDPPAISELSLGKISGYFSVAPAASSVRSRPRQPVYSSRNNLVSQEATLHTVHGRKIGVRGHRGCGSSPSGRRPAGICIVTGRGTNPTAQVIMGD